MPAGFDTPCFFFYQNPVTIYVDDHMAIVDISVMAITQN